MHTAAMAAPRAQHPVGKIICVANLKGGVGKTTSAIMMAEGLSAQGHNVLVIDTDAQANFGWSFLGTDGLQAARDAGKTIDAFMANRFLQGAPVTVEDCIHEGVSSLYLMGRKTNGRTSISLLPCTPWIIDLERRMLLELGNAGYAYEANERLIYNAFLSIVAHARKSYDYVVIDCAPGLNILTRSALGAADSVIIATVPEPLPVFGLDTFLRIIWEGYRPESGFPRPVSPNVLITRYDDGVKEHRRHADMVLNPPRNSPPYTVMRTVVPEMAHLKDGNFFSRTLRSFGDKYGGATGRIAMKLSAEVKETFLHA
jgi:chromosome partitioning protein